MAFIYMLASKPRGTLYIGVTADLIRRVWEHKEKVLAGFTKRYGVDHLVYYEEFQSISDAIAREKRIKRYKRDWKIALIEQNNLYWEDLYPRLCG